MIKGAETFPFDQYQRYWLTSRLASFLRKDMPVLKVLDIGGYLGYPGSPIQENVLPAPYFLDRDTVFAIDTKPFIGTRYMIGDGRALPVKSGAFQMVTLLDTLEHVPKNERYLIVHESVKAAECMIVIATPVATEETRLAEKLLATYLETFLRMPNPALCEHIEFGLPSHDEIMEMIGNENIDCHYFAYGNTYRWLEMMILKHYLISKNDLETLHGIVDQFYNLTRAKNDSEPPCYRTFYVLIKKPYTKYLRDIQKAYPPATNVSESAPPEFPSFLKDLLLQANIDHLHFLEKNLKEKEEKINELQNAMALKEHHIKNLELFQTKVQSTSVYKLHRQIKNMIKRIYGG